jgi:hypothetical protein
MRLSAARKRMCASRWAAHRASRAWSERRRKHDGPKGPPRTFGFRAGMRAVRASVPRAAPPLTTLTSSREVVVAHCARAPFCCERCD